MAPGLTAYALLRSLYNTDSQGSPRSPESEPLRVRPAVSSLMSPDDGLLMMAHVWEPSKCEKRSSRGRCLSTVWSSEGPVSPLMENPSQPSRKASTWQFFITWFSFFYFLKFFQGCYLQHCMIWISSHLPLFNYFVITVKNNEKHMKQGLIRKNEDDIDNTEIINFFKKCCTVEKDGIWSKLTLS